MKCLSLSIPLSSQDLREHQTKTGPGWFTVSLVALLAICTVPAESEPPEEIAPASAPSPHPVTDNRTTINLEQQQMQLLAREADPETVIWLQVAEQKILALYEPERSGRPQGAVLIMYGAAYSPRWPSALESIRRQLPEFGWSTLTPLFPHPALKKFPTRLSAIASSPAVAQNNTAGTGPEENSTQETAPASDPPATLEEQQEIFDDSSGALTDGEAREPPSIAVEKQTTPSAGAGAAETDPVEAEAVKVAIEEEARRRLLAGLTFLRDKGQLNIVLLGYGIGAARAGHYLHSLATSGDKTTDSIAAVVTINARNRLPTENTTLVEHFYPPQTPVLDIYFTAELRDQMEARQRQRSARQHQVETYQQLRLNGTIGAGTTPFPLASNPIDQETLLTRRIRGFLGKYAAGMEVVAK